MMRRLVITAVMLTSMSLMPAGVAAQDETLERVREEIEALELQWSLDRDNAAFENLLGDLADRLDGFQLDARLAIARTFSEHYRRIGNLEWATKIIDSPLGLVATPEQQAQWEAALKGLGLEDVTEELRGLGDGEDALKDFVRAHVGGDHLEELRALGPRAVPHLEELAREYRYPPRLVGGGDPIVDLMRVAPEHAARFLLKQIESNDELYRVRILDALHKAELFKQYFVWADGQPPRCLLPGWLTLLEKLLEEPESLRTTWLQVALRDVIERDALTPRLQERLTEMLLQDSDLAGHVLWLVPEEPALESTTPLLAALLRSEQPAWRRAAAERLVFHPDASALLDVADDPDAEVREAVARSLGDRVIWTPVWEQAQLQGPRKRQIAADVDSRQREILVRLAHDPIEDVRVAAAGALVDAAGQGVDAAIYMELLKDPSPRVRQCLVDLEDVPTDIAAEVARALSRDEDLNVAVRFLSRRTNPASGEWVLRYLEPVLYASFSPDSAVYGPERVGKWKVELNGPLDSEALDTSTAKEIIIRFAVRDGGREIIEHVFSGSKSSSIRLFVADVLAQFDKATLLAFLHRSAPSSSFAWSWVAEHAGEAGQSALRSIFEDAELAADMRLLAAELLAPNLGAEDLDLLFGLLQDTRWPERLTKILYRLPTALKNPFILRVLERSDLPEEVVARAARQYTEGPLAREIVTAILERWLDVSWLEGEPVGALARAVLSATILEPEQRDDVLRKAVSVHQIDAALRLFLELRDESAIPFIGQALREGRCWQTAIDVLRAFKTDAAVAALIEALEGERDPKRVKRIQEALDSIWSFRQERQRWENADQQAPTRESALGELLALLEKEDDAMRIEVIRGIGALGAREAIPRLIPYLRSENAGVREAASKALERLYGEE